MRREVIERDGGCTAPSLDPDSGPCFDRWGDPLDVTRPPYLSLEMDYIRRDAVGARHVLACDHVALCAGHHRGAGPVGGFQWATANRDILVEYLKERRDERRREMDAG